MNEPANQGKARLAPTQRVSQRPGSIPLKTGDPIPDELRAALNIAPVARAIRRLGIEVIQSEEGSCLITTCK